LLVVCLVGWIGYTYLGMKQVAVMALIGGVGLLPIMVTVLVLILMESDALHQAALHKLSRRVLERFPVPDGVVVLEHDDEPSDGANGTPSLDLKS
jgi:hypothetical protein